MLWQRSIPPDRLGRQSQLLGEFAGHAPKKESAQVAAIVLTVLGMPGVDIGLVAGFQGSFVAREPAEERCGALRLLACESSLVGRLDQLVRDTSPHTRAWRT